MLVSFHGETYKVTNMTNIDRNGPFLRVVTGKNVLVTVYQH